MSLCSIIIPVYNALEFTKMCYNSIRQYTNPPYELVFVDNGSTDGTHEYLESLLPNILIYQNQTNQGFARGCNQGATFSVGDTVLFLNNDTIVTPRWLDNVLFCLYRDSSFGSVGPVSNFVGGLQMIPVTYKTIEEMQQFALSYNGFDPGKWKVNDTLSGFCLAIKRDVFEEMGGFDEQFEVGTFEDTDLTLRIHQAGYKNVIVGDTFIHHFGSRTFVTNQINLNPIWDRNLKRFNDKHYGKK